MKKWIKSATQAYTVPAPFDKYYTIVDDIWLEHNTEYDREEFGYPCEDVPGYDIKHLAWAYAKDEYVDELMNNGMEAVELVSEDGGSPFLAYVIHDKVFPVDMVDMPQEYEE